MAKIKFKNPFHSMWTSIKDICKRLFTGEVGKRLAWTVLFLLIYRVGCGITIPFVNTTSLESMFSSITILDYYNLVSGGALSECAIFAIGVSAYINASIIVQLLTVAIPKLEQLSKDLNGQKSINKITQYVGCGIAVVTALGYFFMMRNYGAMMYTSGKSQILEAVVDIAVLTAGAQIVVWLGWMIDEKGIGNGISLIIFTGIISRWDSVISLFKNAISKAQTDGWQYYFLIPGIIAFLLLATFYVVHTNDAERRIPVQYSSRIIGRKSTSNQSSYIPLKLIMSGVMPIIFASTICSLPSIILSFIKYSDHPKLYVALASWNSSNWIYVVAYVILIFLFNLFYISITFDTVSIANNLRTRGGNIPGIRPGKPTSDYLAKECRSLSASGSFVLSVIACVPILASAVTGLSMGFGGTSLLIVVGVALECMDSINSMLVIRGHKGFME